MLLAAAVDDPGAAVSEATTAALAMTALDTGLLRVSFAVPETGRVLVRACGGVLHGAATLPQILLGILEGATVKARHAPMLAGGNLAATSQVKAEASFVVSGLVPGAQLTWDLAYSVEFPVASTGLKRGGPNNATQDDAFGAAFIEVWDPR